MVRFNVSSDSNGVIALKFTATKDQAIVGGLEIYPAAGSPRSTQDTHETAVPPAAAPDNTLITQGVQDLQAAAPWAQPNSAGKLLVL